MPQFFRTVLKNGLPVISCPMQDRESVALGIWIGVGGRFEPTRTAGISHFLEHLLFKGTDRRSCESLKRAIEGIGGSLNGFTSEECTCYLTKVPKNYVERGVDVLADMVCAPRLDTADIMMERGVICEEIKMYRDLPSHVVSDTLQTLLWPHHALGRALIGTPKTVGAISQDDLRAYLSKYYHSKNMAVVACGAVDHDDLVRYCETFFFEKTAGTPARCTAVKGSRQKKASAVIMAKNTEQTHLAMGFHAYPRGHKNNIPAAVLHTLLGGNMSSRLFSELRERRGLAYEIGTAVKRYRDTGAFVVHAGVDTKNVVKTISLVIKQLEKIRTKPVGKSELRRAQEFYSGQLRIALEDTMDRMLWIGERVITGLTPRVIDDIVAEISRVTPEHIQQVAKQVFVPKNLCLSVLGPLSDQQQKALRTHIGLS